MVSSSQFTTIITSFQGLTAGCFIIVLFFFYHFHRSAVCTLLNATPFPFYRMKIYGSFINKTKVKVGLKFVRTSTCRTLPEFLSRLTAFSLGAESISAMFEKRLVHVILMTIPHWLRYVRAPKNCLGPPHTSRQGPTRRFEI